MEHTISLICKAQQGDEAAKAQLVEENTGLIWCVVRRFLNRGTEREDLFQIGSIGLIKAIEKFDLSFEVKFSTYAVPMIMGEIKRFLRDDGMIKVSRSLKELSIKIAKENEAFLYHNGRLPRVEELSERLNVSPEDIVMAMEANEEVESISKPIYQKEGSDILLGDKLEAEGNVQEQVMNRLLLKQLLEMLNAQERRLIHYRYFENKTQTEVAKSMGITQVQVSRTEKKILLKLRKYIE